MADIIDVDIEAELGTQIAAVAATGGAVEISGSGSKRFYGEKVEGIPIDVSAHSGVIDYDPAELVITLRAGSKLREVEALLAEHRQMFGFEPPHFGTDATIGGAVASGAGENIGARDIYGGWGLVPLTNGELDLTSGVRVGNSNARGIGVKGVDDPSPQPD